MKIHRLNVWMLAAGLLVVGCSKTPEETPAIDSQGAPAAADVPGVEADVETQKGLALELAPIQLANLQGESRGIAIVIDGAAFAGSMADLDALRAEASVATANENRVEDLFNDDGNASRQALDTARQQGASASSKLTSAESRARLDWGDRLARPPDASSAKLRSEIATNKAVLFRAEFSEALSEAVKLKYTLASTHHGNTELSYVDRSRAATQFAAGDSVLLVLASTNAARLTFRPGERVPVVASGSGGSHPIIPPEAILAYQGRLWCYVARSATRFDRLVIDEEASAAGYVSSAALNEGDRVVIRGAVLLLSLEKSASATVGASAAE